MSEAGAFCRLEVVVADPRKHPEIADRMMRLAPCPERETPQAKVLESSRPVLCAEIGDPVMRAAGLRSMIVVPLRARDRNIGALTFVAADSRRRYEQHDLSLAEDFARRVATAVDNAWLYQQARYATRARDDLLAMVSHDLGNPLAAILICLAAIRRETATGGDRRRSRAHLEGIERSAHDMKSLIADLLDNATIDAGQLRIARARLGTTQLVSDAVAAVRPLARARSVLVRSQLSPGLPAISGDAARLRRVLTNLLDNAVKFSSEGGTITVEARALDGAVTFSVADTGPGIATEDVPRLFDRFWRAEHTQRTGTGLGLYIAKGVIDAHGGTIWAESKIGEGSKFCFTLPVESPDPQLPRVRHGSNNVVATRELVDGVTCDASPA
jgi:signal transduction histidine kinase